MEDFDLVILGGGSGSTIAEWTFVGEGKRVAVVERKYIGESCPNIACLHGKNIIHDASVASYFRHSTEFGNTHNGFTIDMSGVRNRKRQDGIRHERDVPETSYRFPNVPLKPRFSVKAYISSGDHPASNTLGTFNPLFPKGDYFGVPATTGPINFIDVHPHVEIALPHNVVTSFDWIVQWRESLDDGVHNVPGSLICAGYASEPRYVGNRPGTQIRWQKTGHLWS